MNAATLPMFVEVEEAADDLQKLKVQLGYAALEHNHVKLGMLGERYAAQLLRDRGFKVERAGRRAGDLRAVDRVTGEIFKVEVKTARSDKRGKWQFKLYDAGHTNHLHADILILLAVSFSDCGVNVTEFVLPVSDMAEQNTATICRNPDTCKGKLASYRGNWSHLVSTTPQIIAQ